VEGWFELLHAIISQELHGLMYIISFLFIYLILTPMFVYKEHTSTLLFMLILFILTYFYLGYEEINPFLSAVHLIPVALSLAFLFHGVMPGALTYVVLNFSSYVFLHNEIWPVLLASTCLMVAGIGYRGKIEKHVRWGKFIYTTGSMTVYQTVYCIMNPLGFQNQGDFSFYSIIGAYVSTWFVTFVFFRVKRQQVRKEKLVQSEKDRMIGQMAAYVSHEIRNPLTTTRGFLQMMELKKFSDEERKRYLALALSGVDQANEIISDYLSYAKPNTDNNEHLDITQELAFVVRFIMPLAQANHIEVETKHSSEHPLWIIGESRKLRQCLMNLLKNAIEAMPEGGLLTIQTELNKQHIHITIADTGVGMTKAQIKSLGLPFFTTKEKGTGLGLVVVMSLIKTMNGRISFMSSKERGTSCMLQFKSA
jgi:two-component system sporulation sensor kinase B